MSNLQSSRSSHVLMLLKNLLKLKSWFLKNMLVRLWSWHNVNVVIFETMEYIDDNRVNVIIRFHFAEIVF